MSYKPGHCCVCACQTWITDALGRLVHPLSHFREGYLVFETELGETRLKIPVCSKCEKSLAPEKLKDVFQNILDSGEGRLFLDMNPVRYEPFEQFWRTKNIDVEGVWNRVPSVEGV